MVSKRSVVIIVMALMIVTLSSVMFTVAHLTDRRETVNTFKFGNVEVAVNQLRPPAEVTPGSKVTWLPKIGAKGVDCYVRAIITIEEEAENNQPIMEFLEFTNLGRGWYISEADGEDNWNKSTRVVVYYNTYLRKGQWTNEIFNGFTLHLTNESGQALLEGANTAFTIDIEIEAVQANVAGEYFGSPEEAFAASEVIS